MAKFIDLTGNKFERWSVVSRSVDGRWLCKCDCGTDRLVSGGSLRTGKTKSCGCLLRERAAETRLNDLSGKEFGWLTVLSRSDNSKYGDSRWLTVCVCGIQTVVRSCNLVSGNTASCGCSRVSGSVVRDTETRLKKRAWANRRYREDAKFNLRARMANAIRISLKKTGSRKIGRWEVLVGYTVDQLRERLESTLPIGGTWSDYLAGLFEIDHIVPLDAFNYESESDLDFRRAWALSNLQLLPVRENQSKRNHLSQPFQPSLRF